MTSVFSVRAACRKSRCGASLDARWPPYQRLSPWLSCSTRSSHLIATDLLIA